MQVKLQKKDYFLLAILVCLFLIITLSIRDYTHYWGDDFAGYILESRALAGGTVEKIGTDLVTLHPSKLPSAVQTESSQLYYVWGLPMMLLPFVFNAGASIPEMIYSMKLLNSLFVSGIVGIGYLFFRRRFTMGLSFGLAVMLGGALSAWFNVINADVPELFFALLSFWLYEVSTDRKNNVVVSLLLGIAMYCTCAMRLNGYTVLVLIGVMTVYDCVRSRSFSLLRILPFVVAGVLYGVQLAFLPAVTSNSSDVSHGLTLRGFYESTLALAAVGYDILKVHHVPGNIIITAILGIIGIIGVIRGGLKKEALYMLFFVATYLVLATLPYYQGSRYYMNTLPIVIMMIGYGVQAIGEYLKQRPVKESTISRLNQITVLFVVACVVYCALFTGWDQRMIRDDCSENALAGNCLDAYEYIKENTEEDAVVAFDKPRMLALASGRLAFAPSTHRYELTDADYYLQLIPWEEDYYSSEEEQAHLEPEYENEDFILYRVIK